MRRLRVGRLALERRSLVLEGDRLMLFGALRFTPLMRPVGLAVLASALALPASWAQPKGCAEGSPFSPQPQELWGELKPKQVVIDSTRYDGNILADSRVAMPTSLDIENGWVFTSYWAGLMIFDARDLPGGDVRRTATIDGWFGHWTPLTFPNISEVDQYVYAIDAPTGDDSMVILGGIGPVSVS